MNKKEELKRLIDNPLKPNAVEWAMDSEDVLSNMNLLSPETKHCITMIKDHGGAFKQYNDALVTILKRAYKSIANAITPPPIKSRHQVFVAMRLYDWCKNVCIKMFLHQSYKLLIILSSR